MTHYRNGANFERRCADVLTEAGWVVTRSAGSKGGHKADLVAFRPDGTIALIQCKTGLGRATEAEWNRLLEIASWYPKGLAIIARRPSGSRRLIWMRITGRKVPRARTQPEAEWSPAWT